MRSRKGQAAMEFLMTYGWAILVVLAAIGALAYFGILSPSKFLPASYTISGGFSAGEYKVSTSGVQLSVRNNLGVDTTNVTVVINTTQGVTPACNNEIVITGGLANGQSSSLLTICTGTYSLNQKFKADIKVIYVKSGETLSHTALGSITSSVEE